MGKAKDENNDKTGSLTYRQAGVDIREGQRLVDLIAPIARKTFRPEVMADIGSFGSLFRLDVGKYRDPVLVSGTDGVGTKLRVAFMADQHDTVGIDLVAMSVNDIITCGAEPLFFLDYFATGRLEAGKAAAVVGGIAKGCEESGCSLIGGETAEMPGFYPDGEYDLSGFAVGVVQKDAIVDGSAIEEGDEIVGIASSGLHSNGYSLARKVFFELMGLGVHDRVEKLGVSVADELLRPTTIYARAVAAAVSGAEVRGMAHITGGGIPGNLSRVIPTGLCALIEEGSWPVPLVFGLLGDAGGVAREEMRWTFNMGIGYILILKNRAGKKAVSLLGKKGYNSYIIGSIVKGREKVAYVEA